jgi:hypothetical protein
MYAVTTKIQSAVCMILSAVIISASLSLGAVAAERATHHQGYSVTVTELQ